MSGFFKSECGLYICRYIGHGGSYEAWTVDGRIHWRHDNRIQTWVDQEKYNHPMAYSVGGYSAEKLGQKRGSFTLTLLHCDTEKVVIPYRGNTVIKSLRIVFRRKIPAQHIPKWLR
jgi:hypothetical protein